MNSHDTTATKDVAINDGEYSPAVAQAEAGLDANNATNAGGEEEARKLKGEKDKKKKKDKGEDGPYLPFTLTSAVPISPDTKLFRLRVPPDHAHLLRALPYPVGHVRIRATLPPLPCDPTSTELLKRRPYTILRRFPAPTGLAQPAPPAEEGQHVEVMIKRYDTFGLSSHLHSLKEGDTVQLFVSNKDHHDEINFREVHLRHKHIGIVTAGTALSPMINIMRSVLFNAEANDTRLTLIYANRHEEDILLRKELEELWEAHPSRLTIYFLLSQPRSESWGPQTSPYQLRGRITKDMFQTILPPPPSRHADRDDSSATAEQADGQTNPLVLVCGPKPFKKLALHFLEELAYTPSMYYKL